MKRKILNVLKFIFFLSIGMGLLYLAFKGVNLKSLGEDLKHAQYGWLILTFFLGFISHLSRAMRWKLLIAPLGYSPKTSHTFYAVMIGYLSNLAAPRLGEVVRCGSLNKTDKIPFDSLLGTVIVERAIDLLVLVILTLIVFFAKINFFGNFLSQNIFVPLGHKFSGLLSRWIPILLFFIILLVLMVLLFVFRKKLSHIHVIMKLKKLLSGIANGLKSLYTMKNLPLFLLHTLLIWGMYFLITWIIFFTIPETSGLGPLAGLFILVTGSLGMTVPVQGGIGAYHWIVSLSLTLYGISREKGLVFATIAHESQTLLVILLGAISLILVFLLQKHSSGKVSK